MKSRKTIIFEHVFSFLSEQNPSIGNLKVFGPRFHHWQEDKFQNRQQKIEKQHKQMPFTGKLEPETERISSIEPNEPTLPDVNIPPNLYRKEFQNYVRSKYDWNREKERSETFQNVSRPLYSTNLKF